ncbi:MAG: CaiB/BaiF CoA-transferase family protein [Nitriliruptoraceae bacterium]
MAASNGPLSGITIIEFAAIGPGPYGTMLLADLGAEVIRLDRASDVHAPETANRSSIGMGRNRRSIALDLKHPDAVATAKQLIDAADVVVEGFRPGVMERLGLGPEVLCATNPRLIYARITGWGQDGPMNRAAGHDINYASLAGALWPVGSKDRPPTPPLNLVADFGGGGTFLALGVLAALFERERSGEGQVVDAAMLDGATSLLSFLYGWLATDMWRNERESNLLDGAAPYYSAYACQDGEFLSVGALEPQFYAAFLTGLGLEHDAWPQMPESLWPEQKQQIAALIASKPRDAWVEVFRDLDACVTPVLRPTEAHLYPHNQARELFVEVDGMTQPAPAPRFSRTPGTIRRGGATPGADTNEVLAAHGFDADTIAHLRQAGAIA